MKHIDQIIIDTTMVRVAEVILEIAARIENGTMADLGTTETLRVMAKSIVGATTTEVMP